MWKFKLGAAALAGAAVLGLAGCGKSGPSAKVSGKVTYKNEPLKAGIIYFKSPDLGEYNCNLREDGTYVFGDMPTGTYTVVIDNETWNPDQTPSDYVKTKGGKKIAEKINKGNDEYNKTVGGGQFAGGGGGAAAATGPANKEDLARLYVKLPKKYSHPQTSGLKYTVVDGDQKKDFELTD